MKTQTAIKDRYMRDPLPIRLGGLGVNLARIESFSDHIDHSEVVERLVDESKYFIEWTAPDASLEVQIELVAIQRQLAQWQLNWTSIWAHPVARAAVADLAALWSKKLLERSGLLAQARA